MEERKRVLLVTHEMDPYLVISSAASIVNDLLKPLQGENIDIRILMPRFGSINERRHRLHEVVRLSGINIVVNDEDYPLIIKVASLPGLRLQVYFLDNDDYYRRKFVFNDADDKFYDDNDERMVFFAQGVMETIKKFGWSPDVIHCHGWMTSLIPLYLKKVYYKDPVLSDSKVVYSLYANQFEGDLSEDFAKKAKVDEEIADSDLEVFKNGDNVSLDLGAIAFADKVIVTNEVEKSKLKVVDKKKLAISGESEIAAYIDLYKELMD